MQIKFKSTFLVINLMLFITSIQCKALLDEEEERLPELDAEEAKINQDEAAKTPEILNETLITNVNSEPLNQADDSIANEENQSDDITTTLELNSSDGTQTEAIQNKEETTDELKSLNAESTIHVAAESVTDNIKLTTELLKTDDELITTTQESLIQTELANNNVSLPETSVETANQENATSVIETEIEAEMSILNNTETNLLESNETIEVIVDETSTSQTVYENTTLAIELTEPLLEAENTTVEEETTHHSVVESTAALQNEDDTPSVFVSTSTTVDTTTAIETTALELLTTTAEIPSTTTKAAETTTETTSTTIPAVTTTEEDTTTTKKKPFWVKPPPFFDNNIVDEKTKVKADCPGLTCEFGYKTDLFGNTLCSCFNPCLENKCGSKICQIKKVDDDKFLGLCYDPAKIERPIKCHMPLLPGYCRDPAQKNYSSRFYFDSFHQTCKHFIFTGCEGNANNFQTWERCQMDCNTCSLPPVKGPCKASLIRYYYDQVNQSCVPFSFGGCKGNENNFVSKKMCEESCVTRKEGALFLHGMPIEKIKKYYRNGELKQKKTTVAAVEHFKKFNPFF